jgi:type IV secretory pathway VirB4 component
MSWFGPKEAAINTLMAPYSFIGEHLYVTKKRDIAATYRLKGVDFECLTDEMLDSITRRIHGVLKGLDASFRIYQYVVKRKGCNVAYHRASELFQIEIYWVLLYEKRTGALASHALTDQLAAVLPALASFETLMSPVAPVERTDYPATFAFLQMLTQSSGELRYSDHLDYWIAQKPITISHKRLYVGNREVTPLTLTRLPPSTEPNMLSELLRLPCDLIICSEFKKKANDKAQAIVHNSKKHNRSKEQNPDSSPTALARAGREETKKKQGSGLKDEAASENLVYLGNAVVRLSNYEFLGEFSLRVMLLDAPERATDAINIAVNFGAEMAVDTYGALDSFLSIIPGNTKRNLRKHWILSENYADLALCWAPPVGDVINRHLRKESLCTFETTFKTPYAFNLHEDDLLGVLIFGVMGAGKSFLTNKLIADSQKYNPFTFILDIGNSYRQITQGYRGEYLELGKWQEGFAPFSLDRTPVNLEFLSTLVHSLLESGGYHPSPRESRSIDLAVRTAESLSDLNLTPELKDALYNWTEGRYAHLFNNRRDGLAFADFQAIDFQGVRKQVMGPVFLYIFHLISLVVYDPKNLGRMKQVWADEPWKFVRDIPSAQDHLIEAGKTFRKHNGGLGLTTQSALDYKGGFLDSMKEICTTRLFLANPGANRAFYQQSFDLNDRKLDLLIALRKKEQFLLDTATRSAVLSFIATAEEIRKFSNDPESNLKRLKLVGESAA